MWTKLKADQIGDKTRIIVRDDATGLCVRVHAVKQTRGFSEVAWLLSGALCDADGKTAPFGDGFAIHDATRTVTFKADGDDDGAAEAFKAEVSWIVERVVQAAAHQDGKLSPLDLV